MLRNILNKTAAGLIILLIMSGPVWPGSINKAGILNKLVQSPVGQLPARVSSFASTYKEESAALALDLITYRFACKASGTQPDVANIDIIIDELHKAIKDDKTLNSAASRLASNLSVNKASETSSSDTKINDVSQIESFLKTAADNKQSSPAKSAEALREALILCQKLSLDLTDAVIAKQLGDHYQYDITRLKQAEWPYERAANTFINYGCIASSADVQNDWGFLNTQIGRYSYAASHHTIAANNYEQLIRQNPSKYIYRNQAGIQYIKAGKAREAAGDYAAALELMASHGLPHLRNGSYAGKSYDLLIKNLIDVAEFVRMHEDNINLAISLLREARDAAAKCNDLILSAVVYDEMEKAYAAANQPANQSSAIIKKEKSLQDAVSAGNIALTKLSQSTSPNKTVSALLTTAEQGAMAHQRLLQLQQSADCWRKTAGFYGKFSMYEKEIQCLRSLADVLDQLNKRSESFEARRDAVTIARRINHPGLAAEIVMLMIQNYRDRNDLQNALEGFNELVPIVVSSGNSRQIAEVLTERGALLLNGRHYQEATQDFQSAQDKYLNMVGDIWQAGKVAVQLAIAQSALGQADDAQDNMKSVLSIVEDDYNSESARSLDYNDHSRVVLGLYRELVVNHIKAGEEKDAIDIVTRAKRYHWLVDLMSSLRNDQNKTVARFANDHKLLFEESQPIEKTGTDKLLASNAPEFVRACLLLQQNYPSSYALLPVDPLEIFKARQRLPSDTLVIQYMPTDSSLFIFALTRNDVICRQVLRTGIDDSISKLRKNLGYCEQSLNTGIPIPPITDWRSSAISEIITPLIDLYRQLISPIEDHIKGSQKIIFALPKEFAGIPMQALVMSSGINKPEFLIQQYQISYLSKGTLNSITNKESREIYPSLDRLVIFADPEDNLPGAKEEAKIVGNAYANYKSYIGSKLATGTNLLKEISQSGILHIAAHHKIDPNPTKFELLMARDDSSDGTIGIEELSTVHNPSLELVVLSACDSVGSIDPISNGPSQAVEILSIIGSKSVLGGLWKVSDDAAAEFFAEFYKNLRKGKSRSESLRLAQVSMIQSKQFAHPFYWACFALYGNPR